MTSRADNLDPASKRTATRHSSAPDRTLRIAIAEDHQMIRKAWVLLLAVLFTGIGYVAGAKVAAEMPAPQVICWVLVLSLPLTLPVMLATWPAQPVRAASWGGFAYVTVFSMWLGFFAWYRALSLGGTVRVSQVQLVQPFLALLFAVPVLGETLEPLTVLFSLAVIATVFVGKRMPTHVRPLQGGAR